MQRRHIDTNALYDDGSNTAKELDDDRAGEARLHTAPGSALPAIPPPGPAAAGGGGALQRYRQVAMGLATLANYLIDH